MIMNTSVRKAQASHDHTMKRWGGVKVFLNSIPNGSEWLCPG